jgi:hypothetical protein
MPETRKKSSEPITESSTDSMTESVTQSVPSPAKHPGGRPTKYDPTLAAKICVRISNGEALRQICMDEDMPVQSTVYLWLSRFAEFSDMYTKAREDQADTLADEIQAIADQMPMEKTDGNGNTSFDSAYIQWMRLRVDARKWVAAKLKPRKYGDRVELAGDKDNPIQIQAQVQAKELFDSLLLNMELRKQDDR